MISGDEKHLIRKLVIPTYLLPSSLRVLVDLTGYYFLSNLLDAIFQLSVQSSKIFQRQFFMKIKVLTGSFLTIIDSEGN